VTGRAIADPGLLLDVVRTEGELIARTAEDARPGLSVPGCPGLTVAETVRHVGSLHRLVLAWLRLGERPARWRCHPPQQGNELAEFLRTGLREMVAELEAHVADEPCSTWWFLDQTYGFWRRRMAHEATVHRIDVQGAAGVKIDPVHDEIAIDGIDEVLTLWFGHRLALLGVSGGDSCRVAVRAGDRTWMVGVNDEGTAAWRASADEAGGADAVVTGAPTAVYLWLWGRLPFPIREVRTTGDPDAVARIWALLRLATR